MMRSKSSISVIMPTLNEEGNLRRCAESVRKAEERIVVDGGSSDQTVELARALGCRVLSSEPGRGAQLRLGAEAATGDILLFLHADCWLGAQALQQLREQARGSARLFGAFGQSINDRRHRFRWLEFGNARRALWFRLPYGDQAVFVDRRTYDDVGGFEEVPLMEDVLLARKLRRRASFVLLPGPVHVSARHWSRRGVLRQTLSNWFILSAFRAGVSIDRLARWYGYE